MYVKSLTSGSDASREGLHALPKIMFDRFFQSGGGVIPKRFCFSTAVGTFFEGGHKALTCTGYTATLRENRTHACR